MTQNENAIPLVSIGMPVYNGENFIREAIDSILEQSFQDFELIISDNASTDGTEAICREYAVKDQRIRYYRNDKNLGAAPNYNIVFRYSRGKYFKWSAHDDILGSEFLEKSVNVLEKNPCAVLAYPKVTIIDKDGCSKESFSPALHLNSTQPFQRFKEFQQRLHTLKFEPVFGLIRANQLNKTPLIGSYISSDQILLAELALLGNFCEVPEYLFFRRQHPKTSVSANPSFEKRILWFNSEKSGIFIFVYWRHLVAYLGAVTRAPMTWKQKFLCYYQMCIYFRERKDLLLNELKFNIKRKFGKKIPQYWY